MRVRLPPLAFMSVFSKPLKLQPERYALPEFGDDAYVCVRPLSSKELLDFQGRTDAKGFDFNYEFLFKVLVDAAGSALFHTLEECISEVGNLPFPSLDKLIKFALEVSGIGHKDDAQKN